jgi:hypothetical protein
MKAMADQPPVGLSPSQYFAARTNSPGKGTITLDEIETRSTGESARERYSE